MSWATTRRALLACNWMVRAKRLDIDEASILAIAGARSRRGIRGRGGRPPFAPRAGPREELLNLTVADICEDLPAERMAAARRGLEFRDEIWRQRCKDGSLIDVSLFARTIQLQGQSARLVVAQDITQRLQAEKLQSVLYRIAEVSTSARDLNALYPAIHAIVADLLDARNFYIALYDQAANWLTFPYFVDEIDSPPAPRSPRKGLTEYVLRSGETLACHRQENQ